MNIAMVNIGYPPFIGGSQIYCQKLAERLAVEGHDVTVYTTNAAHVESIWNRKKPHLNSGTEIVNGVKVLRLPLRYVSPSPYAYYFLRRGMIALSSLPLGGIKAGSFTPQAILRRLARYCPWVPGLAEALDGAEKPCHLVHAFTISFESLIQEAVAYALHRGVPVVVTPFLHTGEPEDPYVSKSYAMPHQLALLNSCQAVTTLTDIEAGFLVKMGLDKSKVYTVGAGIDLEEPKECFQRAGFEEMREGEPFVLYLGAATYDKGAVHLVEAMRRLWRRGVKAHLVVAGNVVDHFQEFYDGLPSSDKDRCHLMGQVSEDTKYLLLDGCDLLSMPSRVDSFGLVYLEAWAHRKPVVGARAGGVPEVISHGEDGFLVRFGDVDALAERIGHLLLSREEARHLGEKGYQKLLANYTWDRVYDRMREVYRQVLKE